MTINHNGHTVTFFASGRIAVDGKMISLAINASNGGHYTYIATDVPTADFERMAGRKLTGPGRNVGEYERDLAIEIIEAMH